MPFPRAHQPKHSEAPVAVAHNVCGLCFKKVDETVEHISSLCACSSENALFHSYCVVEFLLKKASEESNTGQAKRMKTNSLKRPAAEFKGRGRCPACTIPLTDIETVKPRATTTPAPAPAPVPRPKNTPPQPKAAAPKKAKPPTTPTLHQPSTDHPHPTFAARQAVAQAQPPPHRPAPIAPQAPVRDRLGKLVRPGRTAWGAKEGRLGEGTSLTFAEEQKRLEEGKKRPHEEGGRASVVPSPLDFSRSESLGHGHDTSAAALAQEQGNVTALSQKARGLMKEFKLSFCARALLEMGFAAAHCEASSRASGGVVEDAAQTLLQGFLPAKGSSKAVDISREEDGLIGAGVALGFSLQEVERELLACLGDWEAAEGQLRERARASGQLPSFPEETAVVAPSPAPVVAAGAADEWGPVWVDSSKAPAAAATAAADEWAPVWVEGSGPAGGAAAAPTVDEWAPVWAEGMAPPNGAVPVLAPARDEWAPVWAEGAGLAGAASVPASATASEWTPVWAENQGPAGPATAGAISRVAPASACSAAPACAGCSSDGTGAAASVQTWGGATRENSWPTLGDNASISSDASASRGDSPWPGRGPAAGSGSAFPPLTPAVLGQSFASTTPAGFGSQEAGAQLASAAPSAARSLEGSLAPPSLLPPEADEGYTQGFQAGLAAAMRQLQLGSAAAAAGASHQSAASQATQGGGVDWGSLLGGHPAAAGSRALAPAAAGAQQAQHGGFAAGAPASDASNQHQAQHGLELGHAVHAVPSWQQAPAPEPAQHKETQDSEWQDMLALLCST